LEIIVVDNHSQDGTASVARRFADRIEIGGPERSAQRNLGARCGTGDILLFLDADMVIEPGVVADVRAMFERNPTVDALVIPERSFGRGFWARCRELEKRLYLGSDRVEAPRAFRRSVFEAAGGYPEHITGGEDWALLDAVLGRRGEVGRIDSFVDHDEGDLSLKEAFSKRRYYGFGYARYAGRSPRNLSRFSRPDVVRKLPTLVREGRVGWGLLFLKVVELAGALLGAAERRQSRRGGVSPARQRP
jgi:glycosyltransferase involved in cell wall biosynthesis